MSDKTMRLPRSGGSFIREADGSLRPAEQPGAAPVLPQPDEEPETKAPAGKAGKSSLKEV